jgi:hypothetical protein
MEIAGLWVPCEDGVTRPMVVIKLTAADGTIHETDFLIDTGADCTVLSAGTWKTCACRSNPSPTLA